MKNSDFVFIALCAVFIVMLTGCANASTGKSPALHDGKYGDYNEAVLIECAAKAIVAAPMLELADYYFQACINEQGVTI